MKFKRKTKQFSVNTLTLKSMFLSNLLIPSGQFRTLIGTARNDASPEPATTPGPDPDPDPTDGPPPEPLPDPEFDSNSSVAIDDAITDLFT